MAGSVTGEGSFSRIPALDGVRGIAIGLVLLHHSQLLTSGAGGSVGVTLFFVLSGFLITSLLIRERMRGKVEILRFYYRRALRLLPAFVVVATASVITLALQGQPAEGMRTSLLAASYVGNWVMAGGTSLGPMSHSWSLAIEEQFYFFWPLALVALWPVFARRGRWILFVAAGVIAVHRIILWQSSALPDQIAFATDAQADSLLVGAGIALVWHYRQTRAPWWMGLTAALALCLLAWGLPYGPWYLEAGESVAVVASAALILSAISNADRLTRMALEWKPMRLLGRISYSAYLWHYPIMWQAGVIDGRPSIGLSALTLAISILLAIMSFTLVEQPVLRWRDRRTANPTRADEPPLASAVTG